MRIGIVGGGASAVCIIDALAESNWWIGSLTIFELAPQLWSGRAYQMDSDVILINSSAEDMSVRNADSAHFQKWLVNRYNSYGVEVPDFAPRAVFGEYLAEVAKAGIRRLEARGVDIEVIRAQVIGACRIDDKIIMDTDKGPGGSFEYVILAVGGGKPHDVHGLTGVSNFIGEPYPVAENLNQIDSSDSVAVIGTGLTAVDTVITLAANRHVGPITLLSRSGVLPAVRQYRLQYELKHFLTSRLYALAGDAKRLELQEVIDLLRVELCHAGAELDEVVEEIFHGDKEIPAARLRRQLAAVDSDQTGLRVLQTAVHVYGPDLWPLLLDDAKKEVLGTYHRILMSLCCPMPPASAKTLLQLMDVGQLEVWSGSHNIVAIDHGDFAIDSGSRNIRARYVINCVNSPRHRIPLVSTKLIQSLIDQGMAKMHADGGLCVRTDNSLCNSVGSGENLDVPRLYAVGDITSGTFFFTFGIPSLVDRCHDIVSDILTIRKKEETYA